MKFSAKNKTKILLVEDIKIIQIVHAQYLKNLRCDVDVASNAAETLCLAKNHYDLILLDIGLPDMNGVDLCVKLKEQPPHKNTRIFALTAYVGSDIEKSCLQAGMEKVLHKPITQDELKIEIFK